MYMDIEIPEDIWDVFKKEDATSEEEPSSDKCKSCGEHNIRNDYINGIVVCISCGQIQKEDLVDTGPEWNNYLDDSGGSNFNNSRCGMPKNYLLSESSHLNTTISKTNNPQFKNMYRWQASIGLHHRDRSLLLNFEKIQIYCGYLDLNDRICNLSKEIYKMISQKKLSRGKIKNGLLVSCILYACNYNNLPRNVNEVAQKCDITTKCIHKTNKILIKMLWDMPQYKEVLFRHKNPNQFATRFCCNLGIDNRLTMKIVRLCDFLTDEFNEFVESHEASYVVAGVIWNVVQVCNLKLHKTVLCYKCNLSIVTLNKIHSDIQNIQEYNKFQGTVLGNLTHNLANT